MTREQKDLEELRTLLVALETGARDAGTFQKLACLLETSAPAREAYVNHIALDVQLEVEFARSPVAVEIPPRLHPAARLRKGIASGMRRFHSFRTNAGHALTAIVMLSLAALVAIGYRVSQPARPLTELPAVNQLPGQHPAPAKAIVARITKQHQVSWLNTEFSHLPHAEPIPLRDAEQLRFVAGLVEITFESTARVVIEGPATFEVRGKKAAGGGYLREGALSAYVPVAAKGFTVHTPEADVVDQGTEFSVRVAKSTEVHVFAGRVDIWQTAAAPLDAPAVSSGQQNIQPVRLKKTEVTSDRALRISQGGGVKHLVASNDGFVDSRAFLAGRQVVISDDFDDGDPQTNTHGTGAGFTPVVFRNPWNWVSESNGVLGLGITRSSRFPTLTTKMAYATSRDRFRVDGATITWKFRRLGDPHNSLVLASFGNSDLSPGGIELAMRRPTEGSDIPTFVMTAWSHPDRRVVYIREGGGKDVPEHSPSPDWSQDIEIAMSLDHAGYQVSWRDSANRSRNWTGAWDSQHGFDFSHFAGDDGLAHMQLYPLGDPQTGNTILLDRVIVTVPAEDGGE